MAKTIAFFLMVVLQLLLMLANYWFTFGLWPISWTSFILCALGSFILTALSILVHSSKG